MSFSNRIQKLASETAVYGVSSIIARMVGFALFPLYSHFFSPDEYGIVSIVYAAFIFLNVVYQYGMESAYLKYASDTRSAADRCLTFSTAVWSLAGTSLVLSLLIVSIRGTAGTIVGLEPKWLYLLYYAAAILLLDTLTLVPFAELRLQNRPWRFAIIRFVGVLVSVGVNLVLIVGMHRGIASVFIANTAASAIALLLLIPTFRASLRWSFDRVLWKKLLLFGLPFVPGGIGYAVNEVVNRFFLESMTPERVMALYGDRIDPAALAAMGKVPDGDYVVGVFSGCIKLAVFMMLVTQMFRYAWQPFFLQHARDDDARPLFARIFAVFTAVALFVLLGVSFFAQELVALPLPGGRHLVAESYWMGLFIVPISLLGYVFQGWYYNFAAGAYIEKQTKYFVHCTLVGSVATLVLNAWLVPQYGMLAAAWVTTSSYAIMALMLHFIVRRFYLVPYTWGRVLALGGVAAMLFSAWYVFPELRNWWAEGGLLVVYAGAVLGLGIIPVSALARMRPARMSK